jgi:RHS repeat-associated protein
MALGESPSAQAQVESRRHHSRAPSERRALGAWGPLRIAQPSDVWLDATYDAWGNVQNFKLDGVDQGTDTSTWPIPHGFAGGLFDSDTGLVRFGVRDYDPLIGRWTARDPILFEGGQANLYVYVGNGPVMLLDPRGLSSFTDFVSGAASYGVDAGFALAHIGAREGLLGMDAQAYALRLDSVLGAGITAGLYFAPPDVNQRAADALLENKAYVSGRLGASVLAGKVLGGIGLGISAMAAYGGLLKLADQGNAQINFWEGVSGVDFEDACAGSQ